MSITVTVTKTLESWWITDEEAHNLAFLDGAAWTIRREK
jgi:hypothetical protein